MTTASILFGWQYSFTHQNNQQNLQFSKLYVSQNTPKRVSTGFVRVGHNWGLCGHGKRVCIGSWCWERKSLAAPGTRSCVSIVPCISVRCSTNLAIPTSLDCGVSSRDRVSCKKTGLLSWRLRSLWGLISKCDCFCYLFWTADCFATSINVMVHHHMPECPMRRVDCCLQGQGHSKGEKCQWTSVWMVCSEPLNLSCCSLWALQYSRGNISCFSPVLFSFCAVSLPGQGNHGNSSVSSYTFSLCCYSA